MAEVGNDSGQKGWSPERPVLGAAGSRASGLRAPASFLSSADAARQRANARAWLHAGETLLTQGRRAAGRRAGAPAAEMPAAGGGPAHRLLRSGA